MDRGPDYPDPRPTLRQAPIVPGVENLSRAQKNVFLNELLFHRPSIGHHSSHRLSTSKTCFQDSFKFLLHSTTLNAVEKQSQKLGKMFAVLSVCQGFDVFEDERLREPPSNTHHNLISKIINYMSI